MPAAGPKQSFPAYRQALNSIAARTGAPLPSLILSFGILHELTAIAPLFGLFYSFRALGVGERVVALITDVNSNPTTSSIHTPIYDVKDMLKNWVEEGDKWAAKVGRRYGVFGYEKRMPGAADDSLEDFHAPGHIAGDVANAIAAYATTKALLPVRIGASLYLSPIFSRRIIEPIRKSVIRPFRKSDP
ncbi:hypothetical protein BDQ17DRAFT_1232304 [Cyathus striatus]|nr:hypothetical protein BDQ17DRAFT_1232304 [Cyathus striatus]